MAIVSQTWTRYPMEDNPLGVGVNYDETTFIDHLIAWFTTNNTQWTISASGSDGAAKYIELKPPAGAINTDDRVLIWGGLAVNAAALSQDLNSNATYVYACYAPNAGTTGFDVSPNTGDPYTGVISSKMILASNGIATFEKLDVYMSDDMLAINTATDPGSSVAGVVLVGRGFNPIDTTDQFTLIAGLGKPVAPAWSEFTTNVTYLSSDDSPTSADTTIWLQESGGDVAWTRAYRANLYYANAYKNAASEDRYFFKFDLHNNTGGTKTEFLGRLLFARGGPADIHGQTKSDGSVVGYSQSTDEVIATESTYYLWNGAS